MCRIRVAEFAVLLCGPLAGLGTPAGAIESGTFRLPQSRESAPVPACPDSAAVTAYATTYDSDRHQVVIFGGATANERTAALWAWDGTAWRCVVPDGPPPRTDAVLAYDARRHVLVLYGGRAGREPLRDTWELSGTGWVKRDDAGPTPEPHPAMAYDDASGAVLLYAGMGDTGSVRTTWRWNGGRWTRAADGPNEEFPDGMLASTSSSPALLVTARRTSKPDAFTPPLYEWRDGTWHGVEARGSLPSFSPQAPTARTARGVLLYAGFEPDTMVATWVFEGGSWRRDGGMQPPRRRGAHMAFDAARGVVVLHGGYDGRRVLNDTWEWTGSAWRQAP